MAKIRGLGNVPGISIKASKYIEKHKILNNHNKYYKIALFLSICLNIALFLTTI